MTVRSMMTICLVGLTTAFLAGPANAQINGMGAVPGAAAAAGGGPSPATIGGGSPSAGMAGSANGGAGLSGAGNPGFANPGISPGSVAPGATTPGLMTAPGTNGTQPITGVPTPSLPAEVPGRVAPRDGGHPR